MKRPLRPEEEHLWSVVSSTVRPRPGRKTSAPASAGAKPGAPVISAGVILPPPGLVKAKHTAPAPPPANIEPGRRKRIVREREDIAARLDLHGMDQVQARAALHGFLLRAYGEGMRAVLVITGKGTLGDGILRRRAPEWLAEGPVRHVVAGVSEAARHHGGAGALYIALKRRQ